MAEEGGEANVSGAPPNAADHEFSSHQEPPIIPLNPRSRKSTMSKSYLDVNVTGTQTPGSVHHHSQIFDHTVGLENYFVRSLHSSMGDFWAGIGRELDVNSEQVGPRDLDAHSKLPYFLRLHGSVLPRMILPLFFVGGWATCITCISKFVTPCSFPLPFSFFSSQLIEFSVTVNPVLLTILGFVVGLALSFRSSSAYERYVILQLSGYLE